MITNKIILVAIAATHLSLNASIDNYFPYKIEPSASNYGVTGIYEIPNARFMKAGSMRFSFSSSYPNEFTGLSASPFEWFEAGYRYAEVKNLLYSDTPSYSGNQSLKDKGFDIKVRVLKENQLTPAIAFGLRDIAGTGRFSSEYIVATKQHDNWDITAGIGWGLLGSEGSISNPISFLNDSFKTRGGKTGGEGGAFNSTSWFTGKAALFGGLEYKLRRYGLNFKLEYDTSNPDEGINPFSVDSRFNLGLEYHAFKNLNFGLSFERGNQFSFSFSILGNFASDTLRKPLPKTVQKLTKEQISRSQEDKSIFYRSLNRSLQQENIFIQGATYEEDKVKVSVASSRFTSAPRLAGRTARIASALSSNKTDKIEVSLMNGDFETSKISFPKKAFDRADESTIGADELKRLTMITSDSRKPLHEESEFNPLIKFPEIEWNMSPALKHQIGGPEGFYLGQLWWKTDINIKFARNFSLYTSIGLDIYNNFDDFRNASNSSIPHVRSDIQSYLSEGKNNLQRFKLEYMTSPYKDIFVRADLGMMEEMFGGIGGEILYRPFRKKYAFGLNLHRVRQRDYDQKFSFRDYETTTGHLGIYYDFPKDISAQLLLGKYLAGDKGATLDLSRRFKSGFALGIFATKTNLSAEEFGEGSFDKGFYFSIPTQLFYTDYRTGVISFGLHPLTKDGGALLYQHNSLFSILGNSNQSSVDQNWNDVLN